MFKSLDLQKTPWKDLGPRNLALGRIGSRGGGAGRLPASSLAGGEGLGVEEVELT